LAQAWIDCAAMCSGGFLEMMKRAELETILMYGPSGSKQETRSILQSHLQLISRLEQIKNFCVTTQNDASEIRWVRMFARDVIDRVGDF
jgi:hypothetical protein